MGGAWTIVSSSYSHLDFPLPQSKAQLQPDKKYRIENPFLFLLSRGASVIGRRDYNLSFVLPLAVMVSSQDNMQWFIFTQPPPDELLIIVYFVACFRMSLLSTVGKNIFCHGASPGSWTGVFLSAQFLRFRFKDRKLILHARKPPNLWPLVVKASCLRLKVK